MIGDGPERGADAERPAPRESAAEAPHRIALAHDWLVGMRGGEHVLDRIAQRLGPAPLYTLVNDGRAMTPAIDACDVRPSFLQLLPGASGTLRRWYLPLMPRAVEQLRVEPCDLLVSTSSAVMKSIRPPRGAKHLCYCHSPARYIWEQGGDYASGAGGALRGAGLRMMRWRFQRWDRRTASRVDRFLANSQHTAARIARAYEREAHVVYPPVRTTYFTVDDQVPREDWLLVVAALEPYKRTELVIDWASAHGRAVKVAGTGSQLDALRARAGTSVEMLGRVSDDELRDLYRRARALVFPQEEDFGIVAVEAQACGCPVIAFDAGGARETVTEATGVRFAERTVNGLDAAVRALESRRIGAAECRGNAERFSEAVFDLAFAREVEAVMNRGGDLRGRAGER